MVGLLTAVVETLIMFQISQDPDHGLRKVEVFDLIYQKAYFCWAALSFFLAAMTVVTYKDLPGIFLLYATLFWGIVVVVMYVMRLQPEDNAGKEVPPMGDDRRKDVYTVPEDEDVYTVPEDEKIEGFADVAAELQQLNDATQSEDGPQAQSPAAAEDGNEKAIDLDQTIYMLFARYDVDGSGTINSFEELEMLTFNLSFRLDLSHVDVPSAISAVREQHATLLWDIPQFTLWFKSSILGSPGTRS